MGRCMYPILFIRDSLRNEVQRFHTAFEETTQNSLEPDRNGNVVSPARTRVAKYVRSSVALLGVSLLAVAAFRGVGSNRAVTSAESGPQTLTCHYMNVSVSRGQAANVHCTTAMLETSQLCQDKCTSWIP
jgi:hypothetical protein